MITRRELLIALGAGALVVPLVPFAQQQGKVSRIGYIGGRAGIESQEEAFRQGLRDLGYVEGQNLIIEWRFAKGKTDIFPALAAELIRLKVDCIIANGATATHAVKQLSNTIPIVMVGTDADPVRLGLVASLARPGGNVTGFVNMGSELDGKRLQLLTEAVPKASRVAILSDQDSLAAADHVKEIRVAARTLGVKLQALEVRSPEELENAFRAAGKGRAEALIVVAAGLINSHRARILGLAVKTRLPVMYTSTLWAIAGGLMSYGPYAPEQYRRAAVYADRILKGVKPADLPVEQPMTFEFVINLKAAKQIGLTIPPNVLARADRVIQ